MARGGQGRLRGVELRASDSPPMARRTGLVALLGLLGFLTLTVVVLVHPEPLPLDRELHRLALEHRGPIGGLAKVVTALGTGPVVVPVVLAAGAVAALWSGAHGLGRRWLLAGSGLLVLGAGQAVRFGSMVLIDRPRPPSDDWLVFAAGQSFPSGHTTTAGLAYGLSAVLLGLALPPGVARWVLTTLLLLVAGLVGASRVVLGVHWTTDVFGGWCLALCVVAASTPFIEHLGRRVQG